MVSSVGGQSPGSTSLAVLFDRYRRIEVTKAVQFWDLCYDATGEEMTLDAPVRGASLIANADHDWRRDF